MRKLEVKIPELGKTITCDEGTELISLTDHFKDQQTPIAAFLVNNRLCPLCAKLEANSTVQPVLLNSHYGEEIYRHTLAFLLHYAAKKLLPNRELQVGHSLGNAYYYFFMQTGSAQKKEIAVLENDKEIIALKNEIKDLIAKNLMIDYRCINYDEAVEYFENKNQSETLRLLNQRAGAEVCVNQCGDFIDLYRTPLFNKTGMLSAFDIILYHGGLLLQFPSKADFQKPAEFKDSPKIFSVYGEYKKWGRMVGVSSACHINALIQNGGIMDFIRISESFQAKKLSDIANKIAKRPGEIRLVLIAGPSSSGKTTTAKRLAIELEVLGIKPVLVSLDDYYLHTDKAPKDENGKPDLECLEALDVPYLNKQLLELFEGKAITLPSYDFRSGLRFDGKKIILKDSRHVLLLEGIHGLNDALTPQVPKEKKFKIYVSALTQLNIDEHNRVSTTDNRLLRRMVRDSQFRGTGAAKTIEMWPSVQRGAEKHIFKFQDTADEVFNSALDYELAVLKYYAEPLLRGVKPNLPSYAEASRLLQFLENFSPIPPQYVPSLSILREFTGESEFKY